MRLLFLHPTPGLGWQQTYSEACHLLNQRGHEVVFTYNGPAVEGLHPEVTTCHFDSWYARNLDRIAATSVVELERRYPRSNLYLGIVSERRICNYSLLDGTFAHMSYNQTELDHFTIALVLFYQEILDTHQIDAVLPHHPDNIHSTLLFEMCRSLPQPCFLIFPDYYWNQHTNFLFDAKYFTSEKMLTNYREKLADYDNQVAPLEATIHGYLEDRRSADPSKTRPALFPKSSIRQSLKNVLDVITAGKSKIFFKRPGIVEGYGQVYFWAGLRAFVLRNIYAKRLKYGGLLQDRLPAEPFVYFPLQRVPEAAMLVRATSYLNQQGIIQALSASLPSGYKLVVKDHPRSMGYHPPAYYAKLMDLPNVVVLKPGYPNHELLEKTELVVTIAGTLGYQQLLKGRPVVMFGRKFYECLEGVIRVDDMNDLPYVLKDILLLGKYQFDPQKMRRSLYSYIATLLENMYEADGDAYTLHTKPKALADLVGAMLDREVGGLIAGQTRVPN